jgi:hypothetical protein
VWVTFRDLLPLAVQDDAAIQIVADQQVRQLNRGAPFWNLLTGYAFGKKIV